MPDLPISGLPFVTPPILGTDPFAIVQGGVTVQGDVSQIPGFLSWVTVTTATQPISAGIGYIANYGGGRLVFTLPATAAVGDSFFITGISAGGWQIAQNALQIMHVGNQETTVGTGGSVSSTEQHQCIHIVCVVANTDFTMISTSGNPTAV